MLAEGGRVAFHEPGPLHSRSADSQSEMRRHGVIENDIVVEAIWAAAQALGFTGLEIALTALKAANVGLDGYNRVIGWAGESSRYGGMILQGIVEAGAGLRIFAMTKGEAIEDSLQASGLAGSLAVEITGDDGTTLRGRAEVVNTGRAVWAALGRCAGRGADRGPASGERAGWRFRPGVLVRSSGARPASASRWNSACPRPLPGRRISCSTWWPSS